MNYRLLLGMVITMTLSSCVTVEGWPIFINGKVSSISYEKIQLGATYIVLDDGPLQSVSDAKLQLMAGQWMEKKGFTKSSDPKSAQVIAVVHLNIGNPTTKISSSPDYAVGGHSVSSDTFYLRVFTLSIVRKDTGSPAGIKTLWQADVQSEGPSRDAEWLAPHFLQEAFNEFDETNARQFSIRIPRYVQLWHR